PRRHRLLPYTPLFRSVRTDAPPGLGGDPAEFDRLPRREGELGMVVLLDQSDAACTFVAPQRQQVGSVEQDRWPVRPTAVCAGGRSEEHTSELQSRFDL